MDPSKRHWPSMFKSKTSINSHGHHWQHDISPPISTTATSNSHRPSAISSVTEERTPDPKPRWNPKPEQIRILEGIFNSGMINPPRDEIRRIRAQLQEYGQVGDANVFYWFQNRKSRSKNKKSNFQNSTTKSQRRTLSSLATANTVPFSYTSSSSDKSLQKSADRKEFSSNINVWDGLNLSPSCSVNQPYFCKTTSHGELLPEPYFFPGSQTTLVGGATAGASVGTPLTRGFCFPEVISTNDYVAHNNNNVSQYHGQTFGKCSTSLFLTDLMNLEAMDNYYKRVEDNDKIKMQQQLSYSCVTTATPISAQTIHPPTVSPTVMSTINHIQGEGLKKSTVFINDVAVEVASGPFDVREAFGEDAVLIHSSGQPVVTNEWGVTLQSLQHGAFYYLVRMITPPPPSQSHSSIHLI